MPTLNLQAALAADGYDLKQKTIDEYACPCPFCGGEDRFIVWPVQGVGGRYWCRQCKRQGDLIQYLHDKRGLSYQEAAEMAGKTGKQPQRGSFGELVMVYDYRDPDGNLLFQVCRYQTPKGKTFRQRRPDGEGGWIWGLTAGEYWRRSGQKDWFKVNRTPPAGAAVKHFPQCAPTLYRLPELLKNDPEALMFIVEGEADADALAALGLAATTNPQGAGKWRAEFNEFFRGRWVVIIPDNDDPGRKHALQVAQNLHGIATSVKVLELPELPEKGDASDWLKVGGTRLELLNLADAAPEWSHPPRAPDVTPDAAPEKQKKPTQAEILISLASRGEYFHDAHKLGFVTLPEGDIQATYPIRSTDFRLWLRREFFRHTKKAPNAQALNDALGILEARAWFDGSTLPVFVRIGEHEGKIYLDLADPTWQAVEIDAQGWRVVQKSPIKFVRRPGMLPLPMPEGGGSIDELRPFLNLPRGLAGDHTWKLMVSWQVAALRPTGPYPILAIHGPQGCAKSTAARMLRGLLDPNSSILRAEPKELRDLVISAKNGWCCALDNLTSLPQWLSDALCRLSTGGGFATRALYTDDEEALFEAIRPVILTGINPVATSQDFIDRQVLVELQDFGTDDDRQEEAVIWRQFEKARPRILGALLTGVSVALRRMETLKISRLTRMADFAKWSTAAEAAWGWPDGAFLEAYAENRAGQAAASVEADLVASTLLEFMREREFWEGTATELLEAMTTLVPEEKRKLRVGKSYAWPQAANVLTRRIRKAQVFLKHFGLRIIGAHSCDRTIRIDKEVRRNTVHIVHTVQTQESGGFAADDISGVTVHATRNTVHEELEVLGLDDTADALDDIGGDTVHEKGAPNAGLDDADGMDDISVILSGEEVTL